MKTDMPSTNITTAQKPLLETSPQYPSSRDPTEERKNPSSLSYPSPLFPVPISTWIKTTEFLNNGTRENGVVLAKVLYHPLYNSWCGFIANPLQKSTASIASLVFSVPHVIDLVLVCFVLCFLFKMINLKE